MRYRFADCELDTELYTLRRAGQLQQLRPKVFHVLRYLVEHRHWVVPRQELLEHVWPEHFISDATLDNCLKEVRRVLGDNGREQRVIHTLRGHGYRFAAALVSWDGAPRDRETSSPARPEPLPAPDAAQGLSLPGQAVSPLAPRPPAVHDRVTGPSLPRPAGAADGGLATDARGEEASLQRGALAPTAEWKLVSVLCCALAEPLLGAPRELEPHYNALHALAALAHEAVQQYGGTLQPVVGEQLMAVFGAPLAQEDHARCAVLAALDLQQRLRPPALGKGLAVRMGIHSGPVVMGTLGSAAHGHVTAVGTPTQGALRLQQQAAPGTLLVSAATYRLVQEEVRGEACGHLALDARQAPLPVYAVQGLVQRRAGVPQRAPRARSPFVGRQQELALLHDRLEAVRAGAGQVVSLVGPPGMGKTRLLTEFGQCLASNQVTWVLGQCLAYGQATPYLPVRDIVQHLCALAAGDPMETRMAAVRRRLAALGSVPEEDLALVLQLLDLPVAPALLTRRTPEALQARTFALLGHLLRHEAQRQPLVLAVENVHWIDPTSAAWLASLVEWLAGTAVLLLVTTRSGYQPPWGAHATVTQLALPPLRAGDSQAIVAAVPGTTQLPLAQCRQIVAYGAGNPFFVEELAWHAVEHGLSATPVPETVHAVLAARIDRLPSVEKRLLQTAAVIGHEIPLRVLHAIAELSEDALQQGLTYLQIAEFLYETRLLPERVYTFKHALTHEVAYSSLLQERRRTLHRRIVEGIEALVRDRVADQPELLAHHALRGERWDQALVYCRQAGDKALARSAHREAVTYFELALSALAQLPEQRATCEQAIELRLALRTALLPSGDFERILAVLREAEALATTLDDPQLLAQVSGLLSRHFSFMGAHDQAIAAAQRVLALATASGDVVLHALANFYLGMDYWDLGDYRQAIDCYQQNVASFDEAWRCERFGLIFLPAVDARADLAACYAELGRFAEGGACGEEGLRIAEAANHPASLMVAAWGIGVLALRQGDLPRALPLLKRAVGLCQDADLPAWVPWMAATLGAAYTLAGRVAEAVPLLRQAMEQIVATGMVIDQTRCRLWLGEAHLLAGHLEEAQALAERAQALARAHQERGNEAYALHLLGAIAARRCPPEIALAAAHYRPALALAETLGLRPLVAHCHRGLGMLYAATGQRKQAQTALSMAMAMYQSMEMTFWLPQTETALAQVAG